MRNIELLLEYDGAPYHGWQRQEHHPSVQASVEEALALVTQQSTESLCVSVAGRTDRGVHARGQRVTFVTSDPREARRFAPALNRVLPGSIRVHRARAVSDAFDVRKDARAKWYRYTFQLGLHRCVHSAKSAWHLGQRFDLARAQREADALIGEHDYEAFRSVHCDAAHARRRIDVATFSVAALPPLGQLVYLDLVGNAFCRHMCRIFAGTLAQVASGLLPPETIASALRTKKRADAGQTAPAHGLMLIDVAYDEDRCGWPLVTQPPAPEALPPKIL